MEIESKPVANNLQKPKTNGHNPPVIDLYRPGPASQIAMMLRGSEITREKVFSVLEHAGSETRIPDDFLQNIDTRQLEELLKHAQTITFKVRKCRQDLHLMDLSRLVDSSLKGNRADCHGNPIERAKVETGIAFVYTEKPNTGIIFTEYERGTAHDTRSILQESANGRGPAVSLFRKILPVTYISRNVKIQGALLQGWGCPTFIDGNVGSKTTEIKMAVVKADIFTFVVPKTVVESKKHKLWAVDITDRVNSIIEKSDKRYRHLYVGTPHTTVFIASERFEHNDYIRDTEEIIAPRGNHYKHNRTAKDTNGRAHLAAAFGGNYNMYQLNENGRLDLGPNRIWLVECDPRTNEDGTTETRDREVIIGLL